MKYYKIIEHSHTELLQFNTICVENKFRIILTRHTKRILLYTLARNKTTKKTIQRG